MDEQGRPVAGAKVESGGRSANCDPAGAFLLTALPPKRAELVVTAPGHARQQIDAWPGRDDLRIVLPREVRVTGVVVHPDGRPAEGAHVNHVCTTGADGRFDVPVEAGRHNVFVTWGVLPGTRDDTAAYGNVWLDVDPERPPRDVRVVLDDICSWVGVEVATPDSRPYGGATVWYVYEGRKFAQSTGQSGTSSWAPSIPPGTELELRVTPRNASSGAAVTVRTRTLHCVGERVRVTLDDDPPDDAPPPVQFPVRVVDEAGNEVSAVRYYDAEVDARGIVRARPGTDGTVRIRVAAPGFVETSFPVAVDAAHPAEARLVLVRAGHIDLNVTDPAYAARRLLVRVGRTATTVENGRSDLVMWDIDAGDARIVLYSDEEDDVPEWWRTVRVIPGGTTPVVCDAVRPVPVHGRVTDAAGRPLGGVGIEMRGTPSPGHRFATGDTCTAPDGTFELAPIDADEVYVGAFRDDLAPAWIRVAPHDGSVADLRMSAGGTIMFRLADGDFVASDAELRSTDSGVRLFSDVAFDDDGRRVIRHAPSGRWTLRFTVSHESRERVVDVREGGTTTVDLRL